MATMEEVNMEASLHSMINTDLDPLHPEQEPTVDLPTSTHSIDTPHEEAPASTASPSQSASADITTPAKTPGERKRKVLFPGSAADFRRKEANRLAADRSRSRAQEKRISLEHTAKNLEEENKKLLTEISKLEALLPDSEPVSAHQSLVTNAHDGQSHDSLADNALHDQQSIGHVAPAIGVGMGQSMHAGNDAQDSHSRTILAALMSAGSVNEAFSLGAGDENDDAWMQGVEEMFKEAESSGRLGELAALATGRNGPPGGLEEHADTHDAPSGPASPYDAPDPAEGSDPEQQAQQEQPPHEDEHAPKVGRPGTAQEQTAADIIVSRKVDYKREDSAARTTAAVAVLLNAEIERILRDDLAATKAAIATVDKELVRLRSINSGEQAVPDAGAGSDDEKLDRGDERRSSLPDPILTDSADALLAETASTIEKVRALEKQIPALRGSLTKIKNDKLDEEGRLAAAVTELQSLVAGSPWIVKAKVARTLKGVPGYVGDILHGVTRENDGSDQTGTASFSSPAIARRRRGRPPKPSGMPHTADSPEIATTSGLAQSITAEEVAAATAAVAQAENQGSSMNTSKSSEPPRPRQTQNDEGDLAAPTPEQYILSHLQDTSPFPHFYPHNPEEVQNELNAGEHPSDEAGTEAEGNQILAEGGHDDGSATPVPEPLSVLSRWKKGAPGSCDICSRVETTAWRKLTFNGEELKVCNACGLYHTKFKVIRPPELWGDGKSLKKRRVLQRSRQSMNEQEGGDGEHAGKKRRRNKAEAGTVSLEDGGEPMVDGEELEGEEDHEHDAQRGSEQQGGLHETDEGREQEEAGQQEDGLGSFDGIHGANMASVLGMNSE